MIDEVSALFKRLGKEVLPPGMKLYTIVGSGQVFFPLKSASNLYEPDTFFVYIVKEVQEYNFKYGMSFKNLRLAANQMQLKALEPHFKVALQNGAKHFQEALSDPVRVAQMVKEGKAKALETESNIFHG